MPIHDLEKEKYQKISLKPWRDVIFVQKHPQTEHVKILISSGWMRRK
jgi:hypothetical protein